MNTKTWAARLRTLAFHTVASLVTLVFTLPLIWTLSASLRKPGLAPSRTIEWIPNPLVWENYLQIFSIVPLASYLRNSLIVVAFAVPLTLLTASWAGFSIAQLSSRLQRRLIALSVLLLMVPVTALWLTRFLFFTQIGLINTLWALIAPALMGSSPFFVLLFYWTFRRIPHELFESARLDGAGTLRVWWTIAMPLARTTSLAVGVLTFALYWSDFINPLMYLKSETLYTLPVGVRILEEMDRTNWSLLMAASVVMSAPIILLFLWVQRYFLGEDHISGLGGR